MSEAITPEEVRAWRVEHVLGCAKRGCSLPHSTCRACERLYPCPTIRLLDAYEALEEEVISLKHLAALHAADANAAREEVERLRGALERWDCMNCAGTGWVTRAGGYRDRCPTCDGSKHSPIASAALSAAPRQPEEGEEE